VSGFSRTSAFAEQALGIVNGGFLSLMLSVGHRTGLLDTMATLPPSTPEQIAAAAGLNARYVREWLGAMVTGRILEYDPAARTYWLPREHAASLTREAGPTISRNWRSWCHCSARSRPPSSRCSGRAAAWTIRPSTGSTS
jgi:hypothetical protein